MRLILALLLCFSFNAKAVEVTGVLKQGGLIALKYDVDTAEQIIINEQKLSLSDDGLVYYPISRNAKQLNINGKIYKVEPQTYKVQHIKGVKKEHVTPKGPKLLARINKETKAIKQSRMQETEKLFDGLMPNFILPTTGERTGVFGSSRTYNGVEKSWHKGLDIANKEGTLVTSPLQGRVVLALKDSFFNGNLVIIDHGKKIYSIYAHMYDIIAKEGEMLQVGDPVGLIGSTGRSTGPHLHWGVYVGQQAIDPSLFLKKG